MNKAIKYMNLYENNGLSKPYATLDSAIEAAEKYNKNFVRTITLDLETLVLKEV